MSADWKKELLDSLRLDLVDLLGYEPQVTLAHLDQALSDLDIDEMWQAWGRGPEIALELKSQLTQD